MSRTPCLIAIVGGSGAGKTWLADQLQKVFGTECARLCLDDFYRDRSHLPLAQRGRINFDHPRAIDWPLVEAVLGQCVLGEPLYVPQYDFTEHRRASRGDWWHPKPLVLVEGLWLLRRPALRRLFSLSIFLDCPEEIRFERRLRRDINERGRKPESVRRQFERTVIPMHERFVAPQARWADVCLSDSVAAAQLHTLAEGLRALMTNGLL